MISFSVTACRPPSNTIPTSICSKRIDFPPSALASGFLGLRGRLPGRHFRTWLRGAVCQRLVDRAPRHLLHDRVTVAVGMHTVIAEGLFHCVALIRQGLV